MFTHDKIITVAALLAFGSVNATPVTVTSGYQVEGLGYYSGTLDYVVSSSTSASLTLQLTNSASTSAGGKITAVALNMPTVSGVSVSGLSITAPTDFVQLGSYTNSNNVSASPFGDFDFGAALAASGMGTTSWLGSGSPNTGIAVNASGTFVFNFTGAGLDTLNTLSFVNAVAPGNSAGVPSQFIAVRFRGFDNSGSDKVGGIDPVTPPPVPVPASVWLMLSGLGGLGLISRKRRTIA